MTAIGIFVGTMYGNSLLVAEEIEITLVSLGYPATLYENSRLSDWEEYKNKYVLIITSTTGQGDLPDNILSLFEDIENEINYPFNLINYGIIALGNKRYSNFCGGGKKFAALLQNKGAKQVGDILFLDAEENPKPELKSNLWIKNWVKLIK